MSQPYRNLPFLFQSFGPLRRKPWSAAITIGAAPLRPILCVAGRCKKKGCEHCQNCRTEAKCVHDANLPEFTIRYFSFMHYLSFVGQKGHALPTGNLQNREWSRADATSN